MSRPAKQEYFLELQQRYRRAKPRERPQILDEVCRVCGYNRKYAIRKLHAAPARAKSDGRRRAAPREKYRAAMISILRQVWEAAGYPWSLRLKALLPLWLPWIRKHFRLTPELEAQLLAISARQMDRRLKPYKTQLRQQIYGRTKPGTLLKHQPALWACTGIPIRTEHWQVNQPGWVEVDLVSHSGNSGDGEFIYSLNLTDIFTGWVETYAVLGKGQRGIVTALEALVQRLPFALCGIDSDNGSEFINAYLWDYCQKQQLQFTRSRPYQKNDNAHIEQKNWTHVRKLLGWNRYDSPHALHALNALYAHELRVMMNWFQPSVKLQSKERVGSQVKRHYSAAQTPLDRLPQSKAVQVLRELRQELDPFEFAKAIDHQLEAIWKLANDHHSPKPLRHKPDMGYLFR